jgi:hypothetical protein
MFVPFDGDVMYFEEGVEFPLHYSLGEYYVSNGEETI